jgi:uncharacterized protein YodC (DUF2158 family)
MATQQQFKSGELVQLKSGGPVMTVQAFHNGSGNYHCTWFAGKKLDSGYFAPASIQPAVLKPAVPLPGDASGSE